MITQTIRVRVGSYVTPPVIHAVQNDTGRVLIFELADFTLASGDTAYMLCKRPSGSLFSYTGTIGTTNRTVSVEMNIDGGALTQVGNVDVQIAIIRSNLIVKTFKAIIAVEADLSGASTPEEQSTIDEILHQIDELWDAIEGGGGGGSPAWGNITGTLADQTDLQNALNAKANASDIPTVPSAYGLNPAPLGTASPGSSTSWAKGDHVHPMPNASNVGAVASNQGAGNAGKFLGVNLNGVVEPVAMSVWTEQTISTAGAVTQALDPYVIYHFTGALTSLTVTLAAAAQGQIPHYHFDFDSGSTAPTLNVPATVEMPDGFAVEASKHYEIDVLNNYGTAQGW